MSAPNFGDLNPDHVQVQLWVQDSGGNQLLVSFAANVLAGGAGDTDTFANSVLSAMQSAAGSAGYTRDIGSNVTWYGAKQE